MKIISSLTSLLLAHAIALGEQPSTLDKSAVTSNSRTAHTRGIVCCECSDSCKKNLTKPKTVVEFGFYSLSLKQDKKIRDSDISRYGPYASIQIRLLDYLYGIVNVRTYASNLRLRKTYYDSASENLNVSLDASLHSDMEFVPSYGLRLIPWKNDRFMLHLSIFFEQQSETMADLNTLDVTLTEKNRTENLNEAIRLQEFVDSVDFEYTWKLLNPELRLDARLGKFTPRLTVALMMIETNVKITYTDEIRDRIAELQNGLNKTGYNLTIVLPDQYDKKIYVPSLGAGTELHVYGPLSLTFGFSTLPFIKDESFWSIHGGIILRGY